MKNLECSANGVIYTVSTHTLGKVPGDSKLHDVLEQRMGYNFVFQYHSRDHDTGEVIGTHYKTIWQDKDDNEEENGFFQYMMAEFSIDKDIERDNKL